MNAKHLLLATVALCAGTLALKSEAANLLSNSSFETLAGAPEGWGGYTFYAGGPTALPGWTVADGSVDVTFSGSTWGPADDGVASLDLNGWSAGTLSQSFATVAGQAYVVRYAYSKNVAGSPTPSTALVTVSDGLLLGSQGISVVDGGTPSHMTWTSTSFGFTGRGNTTTLTFQATVPGNGGVFLDSVSVTAAVPEPSSCALLAGGLGLLAAAARRRRRAG